MVLLDLNMPRMNGHELLSIVKDDDRLKAIPIVILTTSDAEIDRVRAYGTSCNSYVVKPLDHEDFTRMIWDLASFWAQWNLPVGTN